MIGEQKSIAHTAFHYIEATSGSFMGKNDMRL